MPNVPARFATLIIGHRHPLGVERLTTQRIEPPSAPWACAHRWQAGIATKAREAVAALGQGTSGRS